MALFQLPIASLYQNFVFSFKKYWFIKAQTKKLNLFQKHNILIIKYSKNRLQWFADEWGIYRFIWFVDCLPDGGLYWEISRSFDNWSVRRDLTSVKGLITFVLRKYLFIHGNKIFEHEKKNCSIWMPPRQRAMYLLANKCMYVSLFLRL